MRIRTTTYRKHKCNSNIILKSPSSNTYRLQISEKNVHCSQDSNGNKKRLDHESFYQSNIERLLHLKHDNCKKKTN